jgi:triacylglycerol lipase
MASAIPPGFDKSLALKLANDSLLAYTQLNDPSQFIMPPGYMLLAEFVADVFGNFEPFGYLMQSATDAVLAFRGTDDFPDAIADIRYNQAPYPYDASAGATHIGFTTVYGSTRDAVQAAVTALPAGITLCITGHSLGGAVATLAAIDIAANTTFTSPIIYTIASPRVGNPDFANRFDGSLVKNPTISWRVVNMFDLVPLLPPKDIYDLFDVTTYYYQHVTNDLLLAFFKGGAIDNHDLNNYIEALQQLS